MQGVPIISLSFYFCQQIDFSLHSGIKSILDVYQIIFDNCIETTYSETTFIKMTYNILTTSTGIYFWTVTQHHGISLSFRKQSYKNMHADWLKIVFR